MTATKEYNSTNGTKDTMVAMIQSLQQYKGYGETMSMVRVSLLVDSVHGNYGKLWNNMNQQHGDKKQHETKEES